MTHLMLRSDAIALYGRDAVDGLSKDAHIDVPHDDDVDHVVDITALVKADAELVEYLPDVTPPAVDVSDGLEPDDG